MTNFIKDRILDNPITSVIGIILIVVAVFIAFDDVMKESVQLLLVGALLSAGALALGIKDAISGGGRDRFDEDELQ